ncbi:AMP-binding protein [Laribacter hongkongensis]|uniref:AMP-binding protein n=1 Tax=Laribacter hongkongensis TaxID=168471 RepID=UPI001EFE1F12|nr:AMP-binding protein [Laribacter hongkongensis]MCG8996257.1 AMP-binding protein [Laribacter hongkongensis]MCG9010079.1 AMP-binding protein [Laribacter hongkongensis]MCG9022405.1 AMP-binding protein [Laribacter hongkongensis]MCG9047367.1 AMP-binding protein [Laribacter hongkongensis]MCG9074977.1 AMP-binding protein [Laribacter hongkongensis]
MANPLDLPEGHRRTTAPAPPDTFPKLLRQHADVRGQQPAMREKDLGIWQSWNWKQVADEVQALACGLAAHGFGRGERLAVIGDNRPRLYWSLLAAQSLGGVPVPLYQDAVADEMVFVLADAGISVAVVEDQEQVDKLLEIRDRLPDLRLIVYDDPRGLRHYDAPGLMSCDTLLGEGRLFHEQHPLFYTGMVDAARGSDMAIMLYTSGTTGQPKGVVHTFDSMIHTARGAAGLEGLTDREEVLAYLPMAWVGDNLFSFAQSLVCGFCVSCPESSETVMTDMREIGPTYYFAPPRVFENLLTQVTIRMEDAGRIKRWLFRYFMAHARRVGVRIVDGETVGFWDRLGYRLGDWLVYGPVKNVLGFSRIRLAYTAGEAIGPELFAFYRALNINIKQLYGSTEAYVMVCVQPNGEVKSDSVGRPAPGVEVQLDDSGEVLFRSPGTFHSYWNRPDATQETRDADGWVRTGDAGFFDDDGHLRIIDRAKDVGRLNDGTLFAPKYLENKLKFFPFIKEAVTFGDGCDFVTAFVSIDLEAVGNWAERRGLAYTGYTDLAAQPAVYELIRDCIEQVNRDLAADPRLAGSQIHRFLLLHKELDADDGELTRTRKVRRRFVAERYADLIAALYGNHARGVIETQVRFEDGRSGWLRADLAIEAARTVAMEVAA